MLVGPTSNTLHNVQVLSELLSCGQEELKQMIETFTNLNIQPYLAFRHSIMQIVKVISNVMDNIKNILYTIKKCFLSLYSVVKSVYDWLISIVNLCNKKFGTPYEKCQNVFNIAIADCKAKLGPIFKPFCEIANTAQNLCYTIKPLDFDPSSPNYNQYITIAIIISFSWLLALFEPYGRRFSQTVMSYYYPERARHRTVWLYNHILRIRENFLKFVRRKLLCQRGLKYIRNGESHTSYKNFFSKYRILKYCFKKRKMCLICGTIENKTNFNHIKCITPNCNGLFCTSCFADLNNYCPICTEPIEYDDLSDISEEKL
ncbi:hypothetical protein KQX54_004820 [Cotesia glomerata]|uniref:RING-type domain-containing protein n=1 Tax=Cotesia glomerata TaxID=32391 RepID=A0AAV7IKZ5_COTGL|nr:hypothetical protein KQX54_004820 [Cotesia glomerata]